MRAKRAVAVAAVASTIAVPTMAHAQDDISISIDRQARLTSDGAVIIRVNRLRPTPRRRRIPGGPRRRHAGKIRR
jgi:hypothetical protein